MTTATLDLLPHEADAALPATATEEHSEIPLELARALLAAELPEPALASNLLWAGTLVVLGLLGWAAVAPLDEVTRAGGALIAQGNNTVVQHMEGGLLHQLLVKEGQRVTANQPLLELEDETTATDLANTRTRIAYLQAQLQRLAGTASGNPVGDTAIAARKSSLQVGLATATAEWHRQQALQQSGLGTVGRVYAAQRDAEQQAQQLAALTAEVADQHQRTATELAQQQDQLSRLTSRQARLVVRAPVAGTVQGLRLNTPGAVVPPATTLLEIVPAGTPLQALLRVAPSDIAALHPGQSVAVKVSAYDYSRYGAVEGRLAQLSADTVTGPDGHPAYQAWVNLDHTNAGVGSRRHPLKAGMQVQADVVTGRRTVLQYLLRPLQTTLDNAWQEH